jgi:hypothetical protein
MVTKTINFIAIELFYAITAIALFSYYVKPYVTL